MVSFVFSRRTTYCVARHDLRAKSPYAHSAPITLFCPRAWRSHFLERCRVDQNVGQDRPSFSRRRRCGGAWVAPASPFCSRSRNQRPATRKPSSRGTLVPCNPRTDDTRGRRAQIRSSAGPRMERPSRAGHDPRRRVRLERLRLPQPSQVAKAITGTNWNGHRFFGLKAVRTGASNRKRNVTPKLAGEGATRELIAKQLKRTVSRSRGQEGRRLRVDRSARAR